jgi:hypothetical protein
MSSNRHPNDHYPTPTTLTLALLKELPYIGGAVIEPCAAEGRIAGVLHAHPGVMSVITNDIDTTMPTHYHEDATDPAATFWLAPADWIVTNPPFNQADQFVWLAWRKARQGVAMLLRLTYMEPTRKRAQMLKEMAPAMSHLIVFGQPRPSFTGNGRTDSTTTAWFVWRHDHNPQQGTRLIYATNWC